MKIKRLWINIQQWFGRKFLKMTMTKLVHKCFNEIIKERDMPAKIFCTPFAWKRLVREGHVCVILGFDSFSYVGVLWGADVYLSNDFKGADFVVEGIKGATVAQYIYKGK